MFTELIQFSWTITSLIFAAQAWLFLQEFKGNRVFKCKHLLLAVAFIVNVIAAISLFLLFDFVLDESLKQDKNFVAENIKLARVVHVRTLSVAFVLTVLAAITWIIGKNQKGVRNESK